MVDAFRERFGSAPELIIRSPGRVNLIGGHTDYNDGFVLPIAIEPALWLALRPRSDRLVRAASTGHREVIFDLGGLLREGDGWGEYVKGVAWALGPESLTGWDGAIVSGIPVGSGLSSSAALEMAVALAFATCSGLPWDPVSAARVGRRAENEWVGVGSGIMDQLIVATARPGHANLIDCRTLEVTPIPVPEDVVVVILDTGTRRRLVDSAYEERGESCRRGAEAAGVPALRDLTIVDLPRLGRLVDDVTYRRVRHVITENARALAAADALTNGVLGGFGTLMFQSHESLRSDFEVSSVALDRMVDLARQAEGCIGARMTGAGFGGCAVALVERKRVDAFLTNTASAYSTQTDLPASIYVTHPAAGVSVVA